MNSTYNDFILYFQNRDQVKYILKKGENAFVEMKKGYDAETNFINKKKKGEQIIQVFQKLISLTNTDNTKLNKRMKSAKSIPDFLKLLGLK